MAIMVENWSEFVSAVGTSGADVVLPENAVWDMNEILPHFNQNLTIACDSVNGRGAEIKNLHITGHFSFTAAAAISNLKITNILGDGLGGTTAKAVFATTGSFSPALSSVTVSGLFGSGYATLTKINSTSSSYYFRLNQCAFNMEMQGGNGWLTQSYQSAHACRFFMTYPTATSVKLGTVNSEAFNEYVINAPLATSVANLPSSCILRGNLQNVTSVGGLIMNGEVSVFSTGSAPDASPPSDTRYKIFGVTDAQMKSAEYLRSIGFLIGDE